MFTGIVTNTTTIKRSFKTNKGLVLTFEKPPEWKDLEEGESISTDGVCLTVAKVHTKEYECLLVPETLAKSTFGKDIPKYVNLERSLKLSERLSGHFVQGHVDTVGKVLEIRKNKGLNLHIELPKEYEKLVVYKGSITINGVSLTVAGIGDETFEVALIPYTIKSTTLGSLKPGDCVNLEFDIIGKYVIRSLEDAGRKSN